MNEFYKTETRQRQLLLPVCSGANVS